MTVKEAEAMAGARQELFEALADIQQRLVAPKDQRNEFGKFDYRNAEGILAAVKPLLPKGAAIITPCYREVVGTEREDGDERPVAYQVCKATLCYKGQEVSASGAAREPWEKKGMDASQVSGTAMSYAKKYALCNLLAIDNEKDADALPPDEPKPKRAQRAIERQADKVSWKPLADAAEMKRMATLMDDGEFKKWKLEQVAKLGDNPTQDQIDELADQLMDEIEAIG